MTEGEIVSRCLRLLLSLLVGMAHLKTLQMEVADVGERLKGEVVEGESRKGGGCEMWGDVRSCQTRLWRD